MTAAPRLLTALMLAVALPTAAQYPSEPYPPEEYPDAAYVATEMAENVSYGYAQVLRADAVVEPVLTVVPEQRCAEPEYRAAGRDSRATGGTVIGAIVGAALGNQVGDGSGRTLATVAGAVAGGAIGNNLAREPARPDAMACELVDVERSQPQVVGYDVEYMYKGEKYLSRLPYDPGNRLRVRVSVTPELADAGTP